MATSLLSDEMLRQLIAVGQVDLAVGIPTLNHSAEIVEIVDAVTRCFRTHFPRQRAVLVNVDGGSDDGTPELVLDPARDPRTTTGGLRTIHRISARYPGLVARTKAVQVVFAANELIRARALAVIDPDCVVSPDSVAALLRPALTASCDFVTPIYVRPWTEGSLLTQLLRPAIHGIYRRTMVEPTAGEWACSARFASDGLAGSLWDLDLGTAGVSLWMSTTALAGNYDVRQVVLGPRPQPLRTLRAPLPEIFAQVVGTLFRSVELHEAAWRVDGVPVPVATIGEPAAAPDQAEPPTIAPLVASFRGGIQNLEPVLSKVLRPASWSELRALADGAAPETPPLFPDALWARIVYEFLGAYHRGALHRDHLVQALVTPYLGRTAAFLASRSADQLQTAFAAARHDFLDCWNTGGTP